MYDWVEDMNVMHTKYGVHEWIEENSNNKKNLNQFLEFRWAFLEEELFEIRKGLNDKNPEEIVDGLVDLCVIAIGTLDLFGIDSHKAWTEVFKANMNKEVGIKPSRPNPLGLPDLIKPEDWKAPSHEGNHGRIPDAL